jgi:PPOX class probable F420-dependent enzyme
MASTDKIEAFLAEPRNIVVAGIRRDGSPHLSPNWFYWDGQRFYVSTMRRRAKYTIFRRDNRAQLLVDDCTGHRAVLVQGTVQVREDIAAELPASGRSAKTRGSCPRRPRAAARADGGGPGPAGHYPHRAAVQLDVLGAGLTARTIAIACPASCPGARRIRGGR